MISGSPPVNRLWIGFILMGAGVLLALTTVWN